MRASDIVYGDVAIALDEYIGGMYGIRGYKGIEKIRHIFFKVMSMVNARLSLALFGG